MIVFFETKRDMIKILGFVKIDIFQFQCKRNGQSEACPKRMKGVARRSTRRRDMYFFCWRECMCGDETEQNKINQQSSEGRSRKAGNRIQLVIWRYKFDCIFEILLEPRRAMSESQYSIDQEGSEDDYDVDQIVRPKLRPTNRNKQALIQRIHLLKSSIHGATHLRQMLTQERCCGEDQKLVNSYFITLSFRNYNPSYSEPKPPQEKRQTRGKNNKLPSEIISMHLGNNEAPEQGVDIYGSEMDEEEGPREEDDEFSIFNIEIAQILWRRLRQNTYEEQYLLKYKGRSYLHTEWLTQDQINALGKNMKNKINRFNKAHNQRLAEGNYDEQAIDEGKYFDPSYLEVDRIINATQMFPVIHQKKANQIKGKWSESLMLVCSKLLNFTKGHIHYGVLFSEPVDPARDNCPEYPKIVTQPMDLGTIMNKIYLDIYKSYDQFWKDIGLVWKNCLKFNKETTSDLHLLGLTLRQCSLFLYDQWFHLSEQRYQKLKEQLAHLYIQNDNLQKTQNVKVVNQEQNQVIKNEQGEEKSAAKLDIQMNQEGAQIHEAKVEENSNKKRQEEDFQNQESGSEHEGSPKEEYKMDYENESSSKNKQKEEVNQNQIEQQKDYLDMQQFYKRNILLTDKKVQNIVTKEDIQQLNPGTFNYNWLDQQGNGQRFLQHSYDHIDLADMRYLDLNVEINRLYMIKWKNLSYSEATWQLQSVISCPEKIHEFKNVNKALGKEARTLMDSQKDKHKVLVDIENNPKKRSKYSNAQIAQIKNRLYFYDVMNKKEPYHYKPESPHIYKNYKILRSYQIQSLNWLIKSWYEKRNTILADEMGLGKTIQSIAFLYHLFTFQNVKGPFLIIAPLSTLQHWKRTVQQWTNMNCVLYYDQNGQPGRRSIQYYQWYHLNITMRGTTVPSELNKFQILITSYEVFLLDLNDTIMNIPFQFIIVDQAHRLKNKNAKILSALKRMPCKRVLLLTGTPIQNNTSELWSLLNYIHPEKFGSHDDFKRSFGDLSSKEQVQKLNKILKPYMLRRMKQDVQQSIPPLQETIIDVEMTNIQKTIYKALYEKNKEMLTKGLATNNTCNTNLNNLEIQLRKCCNHPFLIKQLQFDLLKNASHEQRMDKLLSSSGKMVLVKKLLEKCKNQGKKVLIFSQFTHMLQLIEDFLKWKEYKYQRIDGQIKAKERQAAIDRYNNPNKKRDVFLLSTKAGGVGINLTSANVVIIYDSDWNPQNDVQATARAHRIGQKSQVQVYRLITCNTYQTEMFERATQKLGLDKAIFIGGHFKQAGQSTNENKLSKNEMQTLLKKGILGFLQNGEQGNNPQTFFEQNVDDIIQNNSRIAKYSLINGSCSFSKSRFVSQNADNQLKINDPNFWNIVLKNVQSPTQLLLKKLKNKEFPQNLQGQKMLMLEASEQLNVIIENKLTRHGLNADDEINLTQFLTMVNSERAFNKFYRDLASSWLQQIYKPSRRFKKFTPEDLVIQSKAVPKKAVALRSNNQEADNIFADEEQEEEQDDISEQRIRLDEAKKDELLKRLCYFCQKPKCTYYCMSFCKRSFHDQCRKKAEEQGYQSYDNFNGKLQINELTLDNQTLKQQIVTSWSCADCSNNLVACLVCKNKGLYYGAQYKKNKKGKKKDTEQNQQTTNKNFKRRNQVTKCSTANCAKYFHPKCIEEYDTKKLFKYIDTNSLHFRCSLHYCNVCGISGDTMSIFQCVRCPKALHTRCMDKQKIIKLSKKQFICDAHFKNKKDLKKATERFANPVNTLKKYIKAEKIQAKKKESQQSQSEKIEKVEKIEKIEKNEKVQLEVAHNYSTRRNRHNPDQIQPLVAQQQGRKAVPKSAKQKMITLTYQDLGLSPIKNFDYKKYDKDWCRYCGSRYSSNFTQGPWGSKTLCTVHYISWKQNKSLNLNDYPNKPESPIDPHNDQELKYLTNFAQKHPNLTYVEVIQYLESKRNNKRLLI